MIAMHRGAHQVEHSAGRGSVQGGSDKSMDNENNGSTQQRSVEAYDSGLIASVSFEADDGDADEGDLECRSLEWIYYDSRVTQPERGPV